MALLATSLLNTHYLSLFGALIAVNTLPLAALVLLYTQPSDVWFNQPLHSENASVKLLWPAQFVIIIVALGLGFIALLIESKINLPLIKADHLKSHIFHDSQTDDFSFEPNVWTTLRMGFTHRTRQFFS